MNIDTQDGVWEGIEPCAVHPAHWVEDCDLCQHELTARTARIEQLQAEVKQRATGLAAQGAQPGPLDVALMKVDILWEASFSGRGSFFAEAELARRLLLAMKDVQRQVLANGAPGGLTVVRGRGK